MAESKARPDKPVDNLATAHYVPPQLLTKPVEVMPEGPSVIQDGDQENPLPFEEVIVHPEVETDGGVSQIAQTTQSDAPVSEASNEKKPEGLANAVSSEASNSVPFSNKSKQKKKKSES